MTDIVPGGSPPHGLQLSLGDCLQPEIDPRSVRSWLSGLGFADPETAWKRLNSLLAWGGHSAQLIRCLDRLLANLFETPTADVSLLNFERFLRAAPNLDVLLTDLEAYPRSFEILVKLFVGSQYLTEVLLHDPQLLERLTRHREVADFKTRRDYLALAEDAIATEFQERGRLNALRRLQKWEMLRLGACDAFGLMDLRGVTVQLSLLAEALIESLVIQLSRELSLPDRGFCVLAFGKLGGDELNYSSDIDLVFLVEPPTDRWHELAVRLIRSLQETTEDGFLYRVDMRLRPWGRSGGLVSTVDSYLQYFARSAALWEKQALFKARPIAGDRALGAYAIEQVMPAILRTPQAEVRACVREGKERIERELERKGRVWGEVKSGPGSIRDVEFLVQYLQWIHGHEAPAIRSRNTLDGLIRLADFGFLHAEEYRQLTGGYTFLRTVEHALQLMHNNQVHQLPTEQQELSYLAHRLDFPDGETFLQHYEQHSRAIRRIFLRHLDPPAGEQPIARTRGPASALPPSLVAGDAVQSTTPPGYADVFAADEVAAHAEVLREMTPEQPVRVWADRQPDGLWKVTVLGVDQPGDLSVICGLFFVFRFDIVRGHVFTETHPKSCLSSYRQLLKAETRESPDLAEFVRERLPVIRDFVNVFFVKSLLDDVWPETWQRYEDDLTELKLQALWGREGEAQGELAKRITAALQDLVVPGQKLLPVEVLFDNERLPDMTVLEIRAEDSVGFLYELTNALALTGFAIEQMEIRSSGTRIHDTLAVTDATRGGKIRESARLEKLRATVVLIKHFTHLLPRSNNPEAALLQFRQLVRELFQLPDWMAKLSSLERPEILDALAQLLGTSNFLWEDFLRLQHSQLFPILEDLELLQRPKPRAQLEAELASRLDQFPALAERREELNRFKDQELFRVDMRHILGHIPAFGQFAGELTEIAEVVVNQASCLAAEPLVNEFGWPVTSDGGPCPLAICAVGKCGGRELGFASDIELLFLYDEHPYSAGVFRGADNSDTGSDDRGIPLSAETKPSAAPIRRTAPNPISPRQFFNRMIENFGQMITAKADGIFEIDLRLRPYGRAGELAVSWPAFAQYFAPGGPAWPYERQALVKLRTIAGDSQFRARVEQLRDQLIYNRAPVDFQSLAGLREKQIQQLVRPGHVNAKLSPGCLVDCEYLVQTLQQACGHLHPRLRSTSTTEALQALRDFQLIPEADGAALDAAYRFFRRLIDALRMVRGAARDLEIPPPASEEFAFLARRSGLGSDYPQLKRDLDERMAAVIEVSRRWQTMKWEIPSRLPDELVGGYSSP